ncbi:hypothetical protein P8R33_13880 [Qipengyuania sp. XHP0211]|uniref:hypothetical protein n=1 Tax=Qipengyuania sp. XHP0211 TaxID=3038079 RepID=UPI00241EEAB2|nr:hypothetical protein [Qipengyuania sp. XHP0211]MDG5752200.1 hypothetical protein [Qipengyuania sp. XHP0211]
MANVKGLMLALGASLAVVAAPALGQASLAMLDSLDKGGWELRYRDGSTARKVCVRSGREFIQLRHRGGGCNRFVVEDGAREVTIQYTCRGNGYGRTSIRKETASLVQIDSQGIADGKPFEFSAEARRTGACS